MGSADGLQQQQPGGQQQQQQRRRSLAPKKDGKPDFSHIRPESESSSSSSAIKLMQKPRASAPQLNRGQI